MDGIEMVLPAFRALIQYTTTLLIILDSEGKILFWNPPAERFFGIPEQEVKGQPMASLLWLPWRDQVLWAAQRCLTERAQVFLKELPFRRNQEPLRYINLSVLPVFIKEDRGPAYLLEGRDVTAEKEWKRQNDESQKFRAIGELSAGIIHEINTPVQFIRNNLQYLSGRLEESQTSGEPVMEDIPEVLQQCLEGMDRITAIIRSLRNYAHPGKSHPVPFEPQTVIEDALTLTENQWKPLGTISTRFPLRRFTIPGYPSVLSQVMVNLIVNAIHAVEEKFGREVRKKGSIIVELTESDSDILINVTDNGIGMDEETKNRMFEPFFTTKEQGKGTGQGLALVYAAITVQHRGSISVTSQKGEGTSLVMTIPKRGVHG